VNKPNKSRKKYQEGWRAGGSGEGPRRARLRGRKRYRKLNVKSRRAYTSVEFTLVVFLFMFILMTIMFRFFDLVPSETGKIQEQSACSQAELMADNFFSSKGNSTTWDSGTPFYSFGLSTGNKSEINYTKWTEAERRGYVNITNSSHFNESFFLEYTVYSFNITNDTDPYERPDALLPRVQIIRYAVQNKIIVMGGSNSTRAEFDMKLTLPIDNPTLSNCTGQDPIEDSDYTDEQQVSDTSLGTNSTEIIFKWAFSDSDMDCVEISTTDTIAYIKNLELRNLTIGKDYPVFLGNHTEIKQEFGSSGFVDPSKRYCQVNRKGLLKNNLGEFIPIDLELIAAK